MSNANSEVRKIIWGIWEDPLKLIYDTAMGRAEENNWDGKSLDSDGEEMHMQRRPLVVVHHTLGLIPVSPNSFACEQYNFFMGNTNFEVDKKIQKIISEVPGVEIVDTITRYRFRVAVGKAFNTNEVLQSIDKAVQEEKPRRFLDGEMAILITNLKASNMHFAIYIAPNKKWDFFADKNLDKVKQYVEYKYRETKEMVGGEIVCSW
jgi:hypothetical protein